MEEDTSQRLLDAAEALFAEQGFAETSLRVITARAKANLAAVHYHFGSKDGLLRAVFVRRLKVLNEERLARLTVLETGGGPVTVEAVLATFIEPLLQLHRAGVQGEQFTRLLGRAQIEASEALRDFLRDQYTPVLERFQRMLVQLLPELSPGEIRWRLYFTAGALAFTYAGSPSPRPLFVARESGDGAWLQRELIRFLTAGLRAPPVEEREEEIA